MHESSLYEKNSFLTLTYDDENLPLGGNLHYPDFQRFMKRLRRSLPSKKIRFYMCGEYGEKTNRPHFHSLLFNHDFNDKEPYGKTGSGFINYTSSQLSKLWSHGHAGIGEVTFESAAYVARYCLKKITGEDAEAHYRREYIEDVDGSAYGEKTIPLYGFVQLNPEFTHMSLKPGIGADFQKKWVDDIYPHDYVVINGHKTKPPRYYDTLYKKQDPGEFFELQERRIANAPTLEKLALGPSLPSREEVAEARASLLKKTY